MSDAKEILKRLEVQRQRAREAHPELATFLDRMKLEFKFGGAHLYPRGAPIKKAVDMQQMAMANQWEAIRKAPKTGRKR